VKLQRPRPLRRDRRGIERAVSTRGGLPKLLGRLDQKLLVTMRTKGHNEVTEGIAGGLGTFGEWGLGWLGIGAAGAALSGERREAWLMAGAVGPAAVAINYGVKLAIGRERPLIEDHPMLARAPSKLSFPSAHSTSSMAAATALGRVNRGAKPVLVGLALTVAAGRPFLGMHYPSDVIAGVFLGRAIGRAWPLPGVPSSKEVWAK
jgi:membrane-associated phospholipid phosphatase